MKPIEPENTQPTRKATVRNAARLHEAQGDAADLAVELLVDLGRGDEHDDGQRDDDHADRAELALEVGRGPLLDGAGDLLHLLGAGVLGEHAPHQDVAEDQGQDRDRRPR